MKTLDFIKQLAKEGEESKNVEFKMFQYFEGDKVYVSVSFILEMNPNVTRSDNAKNGKLLNLTHDGWHLKRCEKSIYGGQENEVQISKSALERQAKERNIKLEDLQTI